MWIKQLCSHNVWDFATAFQVRKLFETFEKRAPELKLRPLRILLGCGFIKRSGRQLRYGGMAWDHGEISIVKYSSLYSSIGMSKSIWDPGADFLQHEHLVCPKGEKYLQSPGFLCICHYVVDFFHSDTRFPMDTAQSLLPGICITRSPSPWF